MITSGDPIPDIEVRAPGPDGPVPVRTTLTRLDVDETAAVDANACGTVLGRL